MSALDRHKIDAALPTPALGALVPYFGAKRNLAPVIVEELGPHHTYFEPFCGSAAVLIAKPKCRMETINDLNGDLVNLAKCIQHPKLGPMLYRKCRRMFMCETIFREAAERWKARGRLPAPVEPDIDSAADYFFTSWVGRNGLTGTESYNQGFAVRYTPNGGNGGTRFQSAVSSIPKWRDRMRDVTILNRDGLALIERLEDAPGMAVYCDPPYVKKNSRYIHDFDAGEHRELATMLGRFKTARVVVSYYDHPLVRELYAGWTIRLTPMTKAMVQGNSRTKGVTIAPEILIFNGPSFAETEAVDRGIFSLATGEKPVTSK